MTYKGHKVNGTASVEFIAPLSETRGLSMVSSSSWNVHFLVARMCPVLWAQRVTIMVIIFPFASGYVRRTLLVSFGKSFVPDKREGHENRALLPKPHLLSPLDTIMAGHKA